MSSYELNRSVLNICIFACTYSSKKRERKQNKIQTESELVKVWVRGELLKQYSLQLSCHVAFINHHISKSWVLLCLEPLERATATLPSCIFVIFAASKEIVKKKSFVMLGLEKERCVISRCLEGSAASETFVQPATVISSQWFMLFVRFGSKQKSSVCSA